MTEVYVGPHVAAVRDLLGDTAAPAAGDTLSGRLHRMAGAFRRGHAERHRGMWIVIRNNAPQRGRAGEDAFFAAAFEEDDALDVIAAYHGFPDWGAVDTGSEAVLDERFEGAVEAIVSGDQDALMAAIGARPELVTDRSAYGHRATLLHYVAANGTEIHRQTVPLNAVTITERLVACGADPRATAQLYGGEYDTLAMVTSSGHTQVAGVAAGIELLLSDRPGVAGVRWRH